MYLSAEKRRRLSSVLEERLGGRASELLLQRLHRKIDALGDDSDQVEAGLKKVRVAITLFVDELLAETVHAELLRVAGLR